MADGVRYDVLRGQVLAQAPLRHDRVAQVVERPEQEHDRGHEVHVLPDNGRRAVVDERGGEPQAQDDARDEADGRACGMGPMGDARGSVVAKYPVAD